MPFYIQDIVDKVLRTVSSHELAPGVYTRFLWQDKAGSRKMGVNEYGCADAANILYTLGAFPRDPEERSVWVRTMQAMQAPDTGLFFEGTHHALHTTAHVTAALELFDARPLYPLCALHRYLNKEELYTFLDSLDWESTPWPTSHKGAGLFASLAITRACPLAWKDDYFSYLSSHADPMTGLGLAGRRGTSPLSHQLFGWFHYLFNFEFEHRAFPYPDRIIDSCLSLWRDRALREDFAREVGFMEIDWVFAMDRASRQTTHRFPEVRTALREFAAEFIPYLKNIDEVTDDAFNDLHMLFGAVTCLAALQIALPGEIQTDYPMKPVLDRRPFI